MLSVSPPYPAHIVCVSEWVHGFCSYVTPCRSVFERIHDDVIKWKHFPRYWPLVRGIRQSPVTSPHKSQWRGAFIFSLICAWIYRWVNNRESGDLRRYGAHYDVIIMSCTIYCEQRPSCCHFLASPQGQGHKVNAWRHVYRRFQFPLMQPLWKITLTKRAVTEISGVDNLLIYYIYLLEHYRGYFW